MKCLSHEIAFVLSLTIVTKDDNNKIDFTTLPIVAITRLVVFILAIWPTVANWRQKAIVYCKLLQISFNSLAFALQKNYAENYCRKCVGAI